MDAETNKPVAGIVTKAENQINIMPWLLSLERRGLRPMSVTTDGKQTAITAFRRVWPNITTQRCLFHIKLQTRAWVRAKPRYDSSRDILILANQICSIKTLAQVEKFNGSYLGLKNKHKDELAGFKPEHPIQSDTLKAYCLLKNAITHCFYYLEDPKIASTTSALEGYFKQIQNIKGFQHCGLSEEHLFKFIAWKLYFGE